MPLERAQKVDKLADKSVCACSDCLALTKSAQLGEPVFIWRRVGPAWRVTLRSKNSDPADGSTF